MNSIFILLSLFGPPLFCCEVDPRSEPEDLNELEYFWYRI
jgi:hypothetical protein